MNPVKNEENNVKMEETPIDSEPTLLTPDTPSEASSRLSESNLLEEDNSGKDTDEELPKSSAENIIPLAKLKNGWMAVSGFVVSAANKAKTVAVDTYNSEQVANIKRRTSEAVAPAWEKTCEVVTPAWEKTCEVTAPAWEKTCEVAAPIWSSTCSGATYAVEKTKEGAFNAKDIVVNKWSSLTGKKATETEEGEVQAGTGTGDLLDVPTPPTLSQSSTVQDDTKPPSVTGPPTIV